MFVKCSCEHCNGHIEFDDSFAGVPIVCPHCGSETKLRIQESLPTPKIQPKTTPIPPLPKTTPAIQQDTPHHSFSFQNDIMPGPWMDEPMTEKQKAMFILYGMQPKDGMTKGEAAQLIDAAINSGIRPNNETQSKVGELFWKIRLNDVIKEISDSTKTVGDETATITSLKITKRNVKATFKTLTDIIDRRIETIQNINREEWLRKNGL